MTDKNFDILLHAKVNAALEMLCGTVDDRRTIKRKVRRYLRRKGVSEEFISMVEEEIDKMRVTEE